MKEWKEPEMISLGIGSTENNSKNPLGIRPLGDDSSSNNKPNRPSQS